MLSSKVATASAALVSNAANGPMSSKASSAQATGTRLKAMFSACGARTMCSPARRASSTWATTSTPGIRRDCWLTGVANMSPRPEAAAPTSTYLPSSAPAGNWPRSTSMYE